jgi:Protein of unknown function (DUF3303)
MNFLLIMRYKNPKAVNARLREKGYLFPSGILHLGTWIDADLDRGFELVKTYDLRLLRGWMLKWDDLVEFEVVRVLSSDQARNAMGRRRTMNG